MSIHLFSHLALNWLFLIVITFLSVYCMLTVISIVLPILSIWMLMNTRCPPFCLWSSPSSPSPLIHSIPLRLLHPHSLSSSSYPLIPPSLPSTSEHTCLPNPHNSVRTFSPSSITTKDVAAPLFPPPFILLFPHLSPPPSPTEDGKVMRIACIMSVDILILFISPLIFIPPSLSSTSSDRRWPIDASLLEVNSGFYFSISYPLIPSSLSLFCSPPPLIHSFLYLPPPYWRWLVDASLS